MLFSPNQAALLSQGDREQAGLAGLLALAQGLMAGGAPSLQPGGVGRGLAEGMGGFARNYQGSANNAIMQRTAAMQQQMGQAQLEEIKRKREAEDRWRAQFQPQPEHVQMAMAGGGGPSLANAAKLPQNPMLAGVPPEMAPLIAAAGPEKGAAMLMQLKMRENKQTVVPAGSTVLENGRPIYTAPKEAAEAEIEKVLRGAGIQPGSEQYQTLMRQYAERKGQDGMPSNIREWQHYNSLSKPDQERYLTMKRANPWLNLGGTMAQPSQTVPGDVNASLTKTVSPDEQPDLKGDQARAAAIGRGQGEAVVLADKKATDATRTIDILDGIDDLIDKSTGSGVGAVRDKAGQLVGVSTEGAKAIAELRVVQAALMQSMPRMEGPQSDRDTQLYQQAAGMIGDPTVPSETRKAAVKMIRALQEKYKTPAAAAATPGAPPPNDPLGLR